MIYNMDYLKSDLYSSSSSLQGFCLGACVLEAEEGRESEVGRSAPSEYPSRKTPCNEAAAKSAPEHLASNNNLHW